MKGIIGMNREMEMGIARGRASLRERERKGGGGGVEQNEIVSEKEEKR